LVLFWFRLYARSLDGLRLPAIVWTELLVWIERRQFCKNWSLKAIFGDIWCFCVRNFCVWLRSKDKNITFCVSEKIEKWKWKKGFRDKVNPEMESKETKPCSRKSLKRLNYDKRWAPLLFYHNFNILITSPFFHYISKD